MATVADLTDPYLATFTPVPPAGEGVCDVCHGAPNPGWTRCWSCSRTTGQVRHSIERIVPITESTPLRNPFWRYARDKIACEALLVRAYRDQGFPATIVRPAHTYDSTMVPFHDVLTWDQIAETLAAAAGVEARIVHVLSDAVAAVDPVWGAALLGDSAHSMVFDNAKLRSVVPGYVATVPFEQGAREIVAWHDEQPSRQQVDARLDALMDELVAAYRPRQRPL